MKNELDNYPDRMRQLLEISYSCGRGWQSSQTGYIHYCYTKLDEEFHHPIPVYENILFALTLMRSRSVENVNEAKEMLSRLLYFQSNKEDQTHGNFPIYLHEFPYCRDRSQGPLLLPVFYWIYKNFHHVLGSDLKQRVEKALNHLLSFTLKSQQEREFPLPQAMKIAAAAKAIGQLLANEQLKQEGDQLLAILDERASVDDQSVISAWLSPAGIADLSLAFQMLYPSLSKSPQTSFWHHLAATWHSASEAYCGPGWHEYQRGKDPQQTLYDYFLGYYAGKYSYRSFFDHPVQLQAALVHPTDDELPAALYPIRSQGSVDGVPWKVFQAEDFAYSLLAKPLEILKTSEKGFHSFKLVWGGGCNVHSMVFQPSAALKVDFEESDEEIILYVTLDPEIPNEKNQEISLYVDLSDNLKIKVQNTSSTTFQVGDLITLSDELLDISLNFSLQAGKGGFFGHIMRGNRPSQMDQKGSHRFDAYDWLIFLRSIRRDDHCVIKISIKIRSIKSSL